MALSESVAPGWDGADGHNSESDGSWPGYIMMTISIPRASCQRSTQRPFDYQPAPPK